MYIDISYDIYKTMAVPKNDPPFDMFTVRKISEGDPCNHVKLEIGVHLGTHIDAPLHFIEGGDDISMIGIERMIGVCKVFHVIGKEITLEQVSKLEIEKGDSIFFRTQNSDLYDGTKLLDSYVTLTPDAAQYLGNLKINLVGIDYTTIEPSDNKITYSVHKALLGNDVLVVESAKLKDVPEGKYGFMCLPLKIRGAEACPVRIILNTCI